MNNKFEFSDRRQKNLEIFGEVGGSEKWKRIALPELLLLRKSTFGGLLAAFLGADRFACYQNRQKKKTNKPHRSAGVDLGYCRGAIPLDSRHGKAETLRSVTVFFHVTGFMPGRGRLLEDSRSTPARAARRPLCLAKNHNLLGASE